MFRMLASLCLTLPLVAAPLRVLTIGDSLSEEYAYEVIFSAPVSDPGDSNTSNWIELLELFRSEDLSHGSYEPTAGSYIDLRNGGHLRNFGIPGVTTENWFNLITTDDIFPLPDDNFPANALYFETRASLLTQLTTTDVVVIFLGGNDLKQEYNDIFNDSEDDRFFTRILNRLNAMHTWLRQQDSDIPIVICTVPDVGATPQLSGTYSEPPQKVDSTRAKISQLNQDIIALTTTKSSTSVARIDRLTDRIFDDDPFHLNGYVFTIPGAPENPSDRAFCRDDFHPSTVGQALVANEIIAAINELTGTSIIPFTDREILKRALALDPDQPYLDWIASHQLDLDGMDDDPDGDGLPNLTEMMLATSPDAPNQAFEGNWSSTLGVSWTPDPVALRFATLEPEESRDLLEWKPIPVERIEILDGKHTATPDPEDASSFLRLNAQPR